ncbi:MAG: hypothetical protein Fur0021_16510 [Candidatus Promineifilaceae bacterium]
MNDAAPYEVRLYDIAIIGMSGRFPGANDLDKFWRNLAEGVESVTFFSDAELLAAGVPPTQLSHPAYVKGRPILADIEQFDAAFFGLSPREANTMDPQQRLFLQTAWHALENAGYPPTTPRIGVYAGASISTYLLNHLMRNQTQLEGTTPFQVLLGNDKDFLATQTAYRLGLDGPAVTVQTACSTSLVAVHLACQALLTHECDIALAGGVSITVPQRVGYLYTPEGIASPDGHCRPFDAQAQGTTGGEGVGIVVLKRLSEALADGDTICAIIRGSAINNDGQRKVSYTAPSQQGQAEVIAAALAAAEVDPRTISYVEAHGTGTALGDPIEVAALTQVFRESTPDCGFCALGAVKGNIGHLDAAAGIAGLIKTTLALQHRQIPTNVNFTTPNPAIPFASSPFYVSTQTQPWVSNGQPRRAGVSSFGIGGTNAHVILQEAPHTPDSAVAMEGPYLLLCSAKTEAALAQMTAPHFEALNLAAYLHAHPQVNLADVAYTLQVGRVHFPHRQMLLAQDALSAAADLELADEAQSQLSPMRRSIVAGGYRPVFFMFPGQGAQYRGMGQMLYAREAMFRQTIDRCADLLQPILGFDLRQQLYAPPVGQDDPINQTEIAQPALFVVSYALAQLWLSWGVAPQAMIGHSVGEYVAACLSGVFTLEDALQLVAERGRLMQQMPAGAMLSVALSTADAAAYLTSEVALAAINAPNLCVLSGPLSAIDKLEAQLTAAGINCRRLHTSHAFHSPMMEPMLAAFAACVTRVARRHKPQIPFISNVTGTWIRDEEATDPAYWVRQLRQTVQFAAGVQTLANIENAIWLEVGPGRSLGTLAQQQIKAPVLASLQSAASLQSTFRSGGFSRYTETADDIAQIRTTLGRMWLAGVEISWEKLYAGERRRRLPLPGYPFAHERHWVSAGTAAETGGDIYQSDPVHWLYAPVWQQSIAPRETAGDRVRFLLFSGGADAVSQALARALRQRGELFVVTPAPHYARLDRHHFTLRPDEAQDYQRLLEALAQGGDRPACVVHLWNLTSPAPADALAALPQRLAAGFYSLLFLCQAFGAQREGKIVAVSNGAYDVVGTEHLQPFNGMLSGLCRVVGQELAPVVCRHLDFAQPDENTVTQIISEIASNAAEPVVAYRGRHRWLPAFTPTRLPEIAAPLLRQQGVYLITGGLGGIGLTLAEHLARTIQARLILTSRTPLPPRHEWDAWLARRNNNAAAIVRRLLSIEKLGGELLILPADVADLDAMHTVVTQAEAQFGPIQGVIHAAGVPGGGLVELKTKAAAQQVLHPKVQGALVLDALFRDAPLDFFVFCSSLAAVMGGVGQADYAAANAYLDALAHARAVTHPARRTLSLNWDTWREVGMAARGDAAAVAGQESLAAGISPAEGAVLFARCLNQALPVPQLLVSTRDLPARIAQSRVERPLASRGMPADRHARPVLDTPYAPPRSQIEQELVAIWEQLLGIAPIGIHDNFLEMGGHSLLATQLMSRVRDAFGVQIPLRHFFEAATVADIAGLITTAQLQQVDAQELEALLAEVENLSPEELSRLLDTEDSAA